MSKREDFKKTLVVALIAAGALTMSACGSEEPEVEVVEQEPVQETQEFVLTTDTEWKNSNYKKYWYKFDQAIYDETISKLIDTGVDYEGYNVYTDSNSDEVVVMGMDVFPKITVEESTNFKEQSGTKIYTVDSEEAKQALLTREYTGSSFVNGEALTGETALLRTIDEQLMLNVTDVCKAAHMEVTENGTDVSIPTHLLPSCNNTIVEPFSTDALQEVFSEEGNMYYAPVKMTDDSKVYVTLPFAKHILGWDVTTDTANVNAVVWMDDIYKPVEDSIEVPAPPQPEPAQQTQDIQETQDASVSHETELNNFYMSEGHKRVMERLKKNHTAVMTPDNCLGPIDMLGEDNQ